MEPPKYWGTEKGKVLQAIILHNIDTWVELQSHTSLPAKSLNQILRTFYATNTILKQNKQYLVKTNIQNQYLEYHNFISSSSVEKEEISAQSEEWVSRWFQHEGLNPKSECSHFYLSSERLLNFSQELIKNSRRTLYVVNPFLEDINMIKNIQGMPDNGVDVHFITRKTKETQHWYVCKNLLKAGVHVYRIYGVHAKILLADDKVAIISSMNMTASSTAGKSWEAGMATFDPYMIGNIRVDIKNLIKNITPFSV
jgi:phosphatidylserine/phosphatidylglycerophosphate/cardiolipin synthase-like enzyme